ncbi:hypothetical protein, conserved [Eimeria tenella]|uniref:Uncharacterized protein n=1 Tax=Eimeria tenella TaxID=5802 RepID=U6KXU6_EIMTE|nr:hypothetical protein, conserved [Eimeria tenella]CDJ41154.1 hypothetical protein, conserved [Eimeria tenella]|eukprot:XP_013231904.1 hypothetical protein, conserved [Eimeria tenella]
MVVSLIVCVGCSSSGGGGVKRKVMGPQVACVGLLLLLLSSSSTVCLCNTSTASFDAGNEVSLLTSPGGLNGGTADALEAQWSPSENESVEKLGTAEGAAEEAAAAAAVAAVDAEGSAQRLGGRSSGTAKPAKRLLGTLELALQALLLLLLFGLLARCVNAWTRVGQRQQEDAQELGLSVDGHSAGGPGESLAAAAAAAAAAEVAAKPAAGAAAEKAEELQGATNAELLERLARARERLKLARAESDAAAAALQVSVSAAGGTAADAALVIQKAQQGISQWKRREEHLQIAEAADSPEELRAAAEEVLAEMRAEAAASRQELEQQQQTWRMVKKRRSVLDVELGRLEEQLTVLQVTARPEAAEAIRAENQRRKEDLQRQLAAADEELEKGKATLEELQLSASTSQSRGVHVQRAEEVLPELSKALDLLVGQTSESDAQGAASNEEVLKDIQLYPEEQELLELKQELLRVEGKLMTVLAEEHALSVKTAETGLARSILNQLRSRAWIPEGEQPGTPRKKGSEEVVFDSLYMEAKKRHVRRAEAVLQDLMYKKSRLKHQSGKLQEKYMDLEVEVKQCERKVEQLKETLVERAQNPLVYSLAEISRLNEKMLNSKETVAVVLAKASRFGPGLFSKIPQDAVQHRYYSRHFSPMADDLLTAVESILEAGLQLRLAIRKAADSLVTMQLIEFLQQDGLETLLSAVVGGPSSPEQLEISTARWDATVGLRETAEQRLTTAEANVQKLQEALARLATSRRWFPSQVSKELAALSFIASERKKIEYYKSVVDSLASVTEEDVKKQVQDIFLEALWTALRRRAIFGSDEELLLAVSRIHLSKIDLTEGKLTALSEELSLDEMYYSPAVAPSDILAFVPDWRSPSPPPELIPETVPNVLQLRRPKKKSDQNEAERAQS